MTIRAILSAIWVSAILIAAFLIVGYLETPAPYVAACSRIAC